MEWVKLIAQPAYYLDAALLRAGEPAEVLFLRGLAYCGGSDTRGRIDKTVVPMIVAGKTQARTAALVREGLWLDQGDHYVVRSWDRWQDEHDRVASVRAGNRERQRRLRDSRARDVTGAVTDPVTLLSRVTSHPVSRDVTALDVDVDVDVEQPTPRKRPSVAEPDGFPAFWLAYPRKVGKAAALKAYGKALKRTDAAALLAAVTVYAPTRRGQDPTYTPHPSKWLNDDRWQDEAAPEMTRADYLRMKVAPPGSNPHMAHVYENS